MPAGRHFLQIPGPTNVPDRILRAIDRPTIDHRGPEFQALGKEVLEGIKRIFQTKHPVVIYPASGTGAWEAALVNTLSPKDKVLMVETGHFATLWHKMAKKLSLDVEFIAGDWRHGADHEAIAKRLAEDKGHAIKAVCVVHNETSTGATTRIPLVRKAIDDAKHPALLMVDTISSLASIEYRHDRHAEATRRAVRAWGLEILCANPDEYSSSLTAVMMPAGHDADAFRSVVLQHFDMSLGQGLSKLSGKIFRIGHLGDFNDLMLMGTLSGVELGLELAGVPFKKGGVLAAMEHLAAAARSAKADRRAA
jgi:aspartate aminotransferase-like enzyme